MEITEHDFATLFSGGKANSNVVTVLTPDKEQIIRVIDQMKKRSPFFTAPEIDSGLTVEGSIFASSDC